MFIFPTGNINATSYVDFIICDISYFINSGGHFQTSTYYKYGFIIVFIKYKD